MEPLHYLANPIVSLAFVQIVGVIILFAGLDSDDEIAAKSSSCWDYNPAMIQHLVNNNYDQKLGVFTVALPTILQAINAVPFWASYICLLLALILRFSPIRAKRTKDRTGKIIAAAKAKLDAQK